MTTVDPGVAGNVVQLSPVGLGLQQKSFTASFSHHTLSY